MRFSDYRAAVHPEVEAALERWLPRSTEIPCRLHEAMRYSVFAGGKRIRPLLVLMMTEACSGDRDQALGPAAAIELIHTFSLVHDDLPALDDDDLRRGQPTVHRRYDEALAILVGDGLLARGVEILATEPSAARSAVRLQNVVDASVAIGSVGMIGGQVEDLECEGTWPTDPKQSLRRIHERKTAHLIASSMRIGARLAGADSEQLDRIGSLGLAMGLLFQIRDDLLDLEQDAAVLGKTPGKDEQASKLTYPALYGEEESRRLQRETHELARDLVATSIPDGPASETVVSLLEYLVDRDR